MSRQPKDYSKGKIYCIRNNINDDMYIGSTCQSLSQRMAQHRKDMTARQHMKLYTVMKELGRENFYIELLEECPCENFSQLLRREGELIREHQSTLNSIIRGRTPKEYKDDNKDRIKENYEQNKFQKLEYAKTYYEQNRDKKLQYAKQYRDENKEKIQEKSKTYYDEHKEDIQQQKKEYYQANKEREQEKKHIYCENNREKVREANRRCYARKKQLKEI